MWHFRFVPLNGGHMASAKSSNSLIITYGARTVMVLEVDEWPQRANTNCYYIFPITIKFNMLHASIINCGRDFPLALSPTHSPIREWALIWNGIWAVNGHWWTAIVWFFGGRERWFAINNKALVFAFIFTSVFFGVCGSITKVLQFALFSQKWELIPIQQRLRYCISLRNVFVPICEGPATHSLPHTCYLLTGWCVYLFCLTCNSNEL